jgi:hypothetical protein
MTPRPGLGVAAVGPITPDGGGLVLTRCFDPFSVWQRQTRHCAKRLRLPELDTALYDEDVLSDEVPDACVGGCREQKLGGTREFIYGCVLLRNRYLPLLSCALTLEGPAAKFSNRSGRQSLI